MPREFKSIQEIVDDYKSHPAEKGGNIYHPIPFKEFACLRTSTDARETNRKFKIIRRFMLTLRSAGLAGIKVLDIGANAGFYTFSLAKEGARVTAFEPHPRYGPAGEFIAKAKGLPVEWVRTAFDADMVAGQRFDCALMLSVFQWMADGGERLEAAGRELRAVSRMSTYLIFELGFNTGRSCMRTSKMNHYAALVDLLREHTGYTFYKSLGRTEVWRGAPRGLVVCSNDPACDDHILRRLYRGIKL